MTPLEFLTALWQGMPSGHFILLWTLRDKRSHWFSDPKAAAAFASRCARDVYVGVGLSGADYGPSQRCKSSGIKGLAGLWADFDLRSPAHPNKSLPTTIEEALSTIPPNMPPTLVIATGNGVHAWWLFEEPYIFRDEKDHQNSAILIERWTRLLSLASSAQGWTFDRLSDLARILRIPGTKNLKDPTNPKEVSLYRRTDRRYAIADFQSCLDAVGVDATKAPIANRPAGAARLTAEDFSVNLGARIPQDLLEGWTSSDDRFRETWLRRRNDLKDNSQSGYDMALANFGVQMKLDDQQIIDLIIHHRAQYGQRFRTKMSYFAGTIAKARAAIMEDRRLPDSNRAKLTGDWYDEAHRGAAMSQDDSADKVSSDPAIARALKCEELSDLLGIKLLRITKFPGKDPTYHVELEGETIEFSSVAKLLKQSSVRDALAGSSAGRMIPQFKSKDWRYVSQMLLDACFVEEGDEENDFKAGGLLQVRRYLDANPLIRSIAGEVSVNRRNPIVIDGRIGVCSSELSTYLSKTSGQPTSAKAVASMLGALGAKAQRHRGQGFREQSRWMLPLDEFAPADYGHGEIDE